MFLALHRLYHRAVTKAFSLACARCFHSFGAGTVISPPLRIKGEKRISIGSRVTIGPNCWFQVMNSTNPQGDVAIRIGSGTSIVGFVTLSAACLIDIGENVLIAGHVYISDHKHAFDSGTQPIMAQGIDDVRPVRILDGAWLGQNVVVCPGVTIGRNSVVGANSVVRHDVPDRGIVAGVPARLIRHID